MFVFSSYSVDFEQLILHGWRLEENSPNNDEVCDEIDNDCDNDIDEEDSNIGKNDEK